MKDLILPHERRFSEFKEKSINVLEAIGQGLLVTVTILAIYYFFAIGYLLFG